MNEQELHAFLDEIEISLRLLGFRTERNKLEIRGGIEIEVIKDSKRKLSITYSNILKKFDIFDYDIFEFVTNYTNSATLDEKQVKEILFNII